MNTTHQTTSATAAQPKGKVERRTRKGVSEVCCRWCDTWRPEDRDHWLAHRDGRLCTNERCKSCAKQYRRELAERAKAGKRVVKTRESKQEPQVPVDPDSCGPSTSSS